MSTSEDTQAQRDEFSGLGPSEMLRRVLVMHEAPDPFAVRMHHGDGDEALPVTECTCGQPAVHAAYCASITGRDALSGKAPRRRRSDGANIESLDEMRRRLACS